MDSGARAQLLNVILLKVKSEGHSCVEVKSEQGDTFILCFLCDERFSDEQSLRVHLSGYLHVLKQGNMNLNVHKSNTWPFNDNLFFFHDAHEKLKRLQQLDLFQRSEDCRSLVNPIVPIGASVEYIGIGKIGATFCDKDGVNKILRLWCEWIGETNEGLKWVRGLPEHEYAVLTLLYHPSMVREEFYDKIIEYSGERSQFLKTGVHGAVGNDCSICRKEMIPNKNVATLLHRNKGFVCSTRNPNGATHVYHVSCLIHWILAFEVRSIENPVEDSVKVYCPHCVETSTLPKYLKLISRIGDGREQWKRTPEPSLENSSIGLCLLPTEGVSHEHVSSLKYLNFYHGVFK